MLEPKAIEVRPLPDYQLSLTFDSGEKRIFDVRPYINGEWYSELLDVEMFNTVHISGLSIEWDGGQDIAPDCLYAHSIPAS